MMTTKTQQNNSKTIVFDTETSGLFGKSNNPTNIDIFNLQVEDFYIYYKEIGDVLMSYPRILQLSFLVYDYSVNQLQCGEYYIQKPRDYKINSFITKLTNIDNKILIRKGVSITDALENFINEYQQANDIISHNISFDYKVVVSEIVRIIIDNIQQDNLIFDINKWIYYYDVITSQEFLNKHYCTMKNTLRLCNIVRINKNGVQFIKFPKLCELYEFLFGEKCKNMHDSFCDCFCCLRCYYMIKYNVDLYNDNKVVRVFFKLNNNI